MLYKERTPKTNLRGSQSGGYATLSTSQKYFLARTHARAREHIPAVRKQNSH